MQLLLDDANGAALIRSATGARVEVGERVFEDSFLLTPDAIVAQWHDGDLLALDSAAAASVLALGPAVVLLGTGATQQFPPAAFIAEFLSRGIGIEVMNTPAAARTYNVLASEARRVVAAFWWPKD